MPEIYTTSTTEPQSETKSAKEAVTGRQDPWLWAIYLALVILSLIELYSASSREVTANHIFYPLVRHGLLLGIGAVIIFGLSRVNYRKFYYYIPWFVLGSIIMMTYVLFNGEIINGARRSLTIAGFSLYPSEFLKLSAVLVIALIMSKTHIKKNFNPNTCVWTTAGVVLLMGALLFSQGLTNTLLLMCISMSMMIVGGIKIKKLLLVMLVYGVAAAGGFAFKQWKATVRETANIEATTTQTSQSDESKKEDVNRFQLWVARLTNFFDSTPKYEM